jgi:hypothetical protein
MIQVPNGLLPHFQPASARMAAKLMMNEMQNEVLLKVFKQWCLLHVCIKVKTESQALISLGGLILHLRV